MKCPICNKETWNCNPVRWGPEFAHRECVARIGPQPFAGPDWPEGPLQDDDWAGDDPPESIEKLTIEPCRLDCVALEFIDSLHHKRKNIGLSTEEISQWVRDGYLRESLQKHLARSTSTFVASDK